MAKDPAGRYESAELLRSDLLDLRQDIDGPAAVSRPVVHGFVYARTPSRRSVPIQGADRRGRRCHAAGGVVRSGAVSPRPPRSRRPRPSSGTTAGPAPSARARIFRRARRWSARSRSTTRSPWRALDRPKRTRRSNSPTEPGRNCCRPWRCSRIARRCRRRVDVSGRRRGNAEPQLQDGDRQVFADRGFGSRRGKVCGICRSRPRLREGRESRQSHRIVREGDATGSAVGRRIPPFRHSLWPSPGTPQGERRILEGAGHLSGHVEPGRAGRGVLPTGIVAGQDQETARSQRAAGTISGDVTKFVQRLPIDQDRIATQQRVLR